MVRMKVLGKILAGAMVCGSLIAGGAFGNPAQSSDTGKATVTAKTTTPAKQLNPQTTCPVMGGDINKSVFVDVNGKRIYACCPGCLDAIKKEPDKYIRKLAEMGQSVETIGATNAASAGETSKKSVAMTSDSSKMKCPMMNDTSKIKGCYTCSMHPEVMQKSAGKCPKCGMDLVFQTCKMDGKGKGGCCKMRKQ